MAEDHLTNLTMLLDQARTHLSAGMERAGFAAPGQRPVMHHQVGDHAIYMLAPPDGKDIIALNRLKCKHSSKLLDCRVDHNSNHQEVTLTVDNPRPALKSTATREQPAKKVAMKDPVNPSSDIRENPDALKNTRAMDTIFIGGETLSEMKE